MSICVYSQQIEYCEPQDVRLYYFPEEYMAGINPHTALGFSKEHTLDVCHAIVDYCHRLFEPFSDGEFLEYNEYTIKAIQDYVNNLVVPIPPLKDDKHLEVWKYVSLKTYEDVANRLKDTPCHRHPSVIVQEITAILSEFINNEPEEVLKKYLPEERSVKTAFAIRKNKKLLVPLFEMIRVLIKEVVTRNDLCKEEHKDDSIEVSIAQNFLNKTYARLNHDDHA